MKDLILFLERDSTPLDIHGTLEEWLLSEKIDVKRRIPIFIFDVWNTFLFEKDGTITCDEVMYSIILLIKTNFNVFFLSYDSKIDRMQFNSKKIRSYPGLEDIPIIFVKPKIKGVVIKAIFDTMIKENGDENYIIFCDDSEFNISNVRKNFTTQQLKKVKMIQWVPPSKNIKENEKSCKRLIGYL